MSGTLRQFVQMKMWFFNGHESLEWKVPWFCCVTLRHFDGLKIRFLKFRETLGSMFRDYQWFENATHDGSLDNQPTFRWLLVKAFSLRFVSMKMRFRKGHEYETSYSPTWTLDLYLSP
jgi:hypothetical protein